MKILEFAGAAALATVVLTGSASAITVTATFDGQVSANSSWDSDVAGAEATFIIEGDAEAPATSVTALPFGVFPDTFGSAARYAIDLLTLRVPGVDDFGRPGSSIDVTSTGVSFYVVDNAVDGTDRFDALYAINDSALLPNSGDNLFLEYIAIFDPDTLTGTDLDEAAERGLANAPTVTQFVTYSPDPGGFLVADLAISSLVFTDDPVVVPDPPVVAPVPLPASLGFVLAGLGALGVMRRRGERLTM